ncbi:hypothetical protein OTB20_11430 [Streptomyces sp. H27-H1]|uniref:hypothetical protein n=1 Tax=Streptomyces sp. H27-H1 TaxID=2996461 RepID=UPI00226EF871|nr:hypothetical protein [Streptomyces sp. H27-H1]MCY0926804.1 hypothetical protein [Streptomyces sp. H27-H1]
MSEVAVRGGMVYVWRAGHTKVWQALKAGKVPNLLVSLAIVDNLRRDTVNLSGHSTRACVMS